MVKKKAYQIERENNIKEQLKGATGNRKRELEYQLATVKEPHSPYKKSQGRLEIEFT